MILLKPFSGAHTNAMKNYVSPVVEKNPDLLTIHTGTNDLKSAKPLEEIANEVIS